MIVFYKTLQIHCSTTKTITGLGKIKPVARFIITNTNTFTG